MPHFHYSELHSWLKQIHNKIFINSLIQPVKFKTMEKEIYKMPHIKRKIPISKQEFSKWDFQLPNNMILPTIFREILLNSVWFFWILQDSDRFFNNLHDSAWFCEILSGCARYSGAQIIVYPPISCPTFWSVQPKVPRVWKQMIYHPKAPTHSY